MEKKGFRAAAALLLCLLMLSAAAMASGTHACADADGDHFCDECWQRVADLCADTDGDHCCDVCWEPVSTHCADSDGDGYCDVCGAHLLHADQDGNHACDLCWTVLSHCTDEDKNHLCDLCGGVFWVDENADGVCDGCDAVLTHVTAHHTQVYYHEKDGVTVADLVIEVKVESYLEEGEGTPAGTVSVRWSDADGNSYATNEAVLSFGQTTAVLEYPGLPLDVLYAGGRVVFTPYDAGFTPAENGCVIEYDLPCLRLDSDSEFTVNGVYENELYLRPGTAVTVVLQPGLIERWVWVFAEGYAVPEVTVDGLTTTFVMPGEDVTMHAAWRCEVCTDADGDQWCDLCEYYVEPPVEEEESAGVWYAGAVEFVLEGGLMVPADGTDFLPEEGATRADFLLALWKLEGGPVVNYLMTFTDVGQEEPYAEAVRWAAAMGIAKGFPDGTFRPGAVLSRQEMATFLYRYEQTKGGGFTGMWMFLLDCTDRADVAEWAYEPLCWLTMHGIVNGDGTGALKPQDTATRAEMAQILKNYLEK